VVKFGAPLKAGITAMVLEGGSVDAVKPDSTVRLSLSITGQGGEGYSAGSITKAGARLPPPAFTIRAKDGKEVASGSFQYG
jgi:hypothetical protein